MPLAVFLPRKTMKDDKRIINLNNYRNWHRMVESKIKKAYTKIAIEKIREAGIEVPTGFRVSLSYRMYRASRRRIDRMNVLSVHSKYFEDAMTEAGAFPDDNDDYIEAHVFRSGGLSRENPRVEIEIRLVSASQPELF